MLPTFIIAGAQKSGTTSLWYYLKAHPQVGMAMIKEPTFFTNVPGCGNSPDGTASRFPGYYDRGPEWYQSLYQGCANAKAIGEASTIYMTEADSPGLIKGSIPDVKLIFLLRDPVERAYSNYWQEVKEGWSVPSFPELVDQHHPALQRYLYVSSYQLHLERYLHIFPARQLSVYLYDDLIHKPAELIRQAYRFIGVDENFTPKNLGQVYNQKMTFRSRHFNQLLENLAYCWRRVLKIEPPGWMSKIALNFIDLNSRPVSHPALSRPLRLRLITEFSATIDYVERFLGRSLLAWRKV
jgi:hypothetical protein